MTTQRIDGFQHRGKAWPFRVAAFVLFCIILQGCATPSDNLNYFATEQNFERTTLRVKGFELLVYKSEVDLLLDQDQGDASKILHVYLEGDGSPWRYRTMIMADPTPRYPLMLRLMALDQLPSVYIGRPCYNGTSADPGCDNRLWTSGRYSSQVVNSMAAAIEVLITRHGPEEIRLFGHSGGGALALLLAEQIPQVTQVITIAGNLDIDAWTSHHGYTPLYSSINPAKQPELRPQVKQWHFVGGRDSVVPAQIIRPFIVNQSAASGFLYEGYDHGCCWANLWPTVLRALSHGSPRLMLDAQFKSAATVLDAPDSQ